VLLVSYDFILVENDTENIPHAVDILGNMAGFVESDVDDESVTNLPVESPREIQFI
jgi:hypothetical protein